MLNYVCSFLEFEEKINFTTTQKYIYSICRQTYYDFWYKVENLDKLTNAYIHERVRKIKNYNGELIDTKIWNNINYIKCNTNIKQTDIKMLVDKKYVSLHGCKNITDVSILSNCDELNLFGCVNVSDVSMLGNVSILNLSKCNI